jgi:type VI secretion system protein ImpA
VENLSVFDVDQLIAPISDESPSGDNLEYEPEFGELEREALGKAEQQMGDEVVEAEPPDWRSVAKQAEELFGRSKDLRLAVLLTRSGLNVHGPQGLADGVAIIRGLLESQWDTVHPQLDEEDNDDPTFRVNSVMQISDQGGMLHDLLLMPIVSSKAVGRFGLRDIRVANGELQPLSDEGQIPDSALIHAAFMDCDLDELQADAAAIDAVIEDLGKCEAVFAEKIGAANSPDIDGLVKEAKEIKKAYAEALVSRGIGVEVAEGEAGVAGGGAPARISGEVNSREDVTLLLGKICTFYERNEPSSPIPILLQRVKRLVPMDYMEIMTELTPEAVNAVKALAGMKD